MIKDDNYVTILGWMCSKLKLKGNSLLIYAIIYSFCQDGESCYHGSLNYLCEFTNSSRQGVINVLNDLIDHQLIIKEQGFPNNKYKINVNLISDEVKKVDLDVNLVNLESKQTLQNNKYNNKENNKDNNICLLESQSSQKDNVYLKASSERDTILEIVCEMNQVWKTSFRNNSNLTVKSIKARLKEGYTKEDFFMVIQDRYNKWGKNPTKFSNGQLSSAYLRPSTVFSPKMENYLEEAKRDLVKVDDTTKIESAKRSEERSTKVF